MDDAIVVAVSWNSFSIVACADCFAFSPPEVKRRQSVTSEVAIAFFDIRMETEQDAREQDDMWH